MKKLINKIREIPPVFAVLYLYFGLAIAFVGGVGLWNNLPSKKAERERHDRWLFEAWSKSHPGNEHLSFEEWSALRCNRLLPGQSPSRK